MVADAGLQQLTHGIITPGYDFCNRQANRVVFSIRHAISNEFPTFGSMT